MASTTSPSLTAREREVLRGVLDHKTAKEMAREFGVSHHAIEQRLKRARQKLGASTSLEAARLYEAHYDQPVYDAPGLAEDVDSDQVEPRWRHIMRRPVAKGAIAMTFIAILAIAGAASLGGDSDKFDAIDKDRSGSIEFSEFEAAAKPQKVSTTRIRTDKNGTTTDGKSVPFSQGKVSVRMIFDAMDKDGSGSLSRDEYASALTDGPIRIVKSERVIRP